MLAQNRKQKGMLKISVEEVVNSQASLLYKTTLADQPKTAI